MNDNTESSGSSAKHVSFSQLVEIIDDSAFEYVDLPPIIFEAFGESDSTMSFTELTESSISDRYYEAQETSANNAASYEQQNYCAFGDGLPSSALSFNDLHDIEDCINHDEGIREVAILSPATPAAAPAVYNDADLVSQIDDDSVPKQEASFFYRFMGVMSVFVSFSGAIGMLVNFFCSSDQPSHDDVIDIAVAASGTSNKGFMITSVTGDGGTTYVT
jgi:hypothetical protein